MEPENPTPAPEVPSTYTTSLQFSADPGGPAEALDSGPGDSEIGPGEPRDFRWVFIGPEGLRAGWSVLLFVSLTIIFGFMVNFIAAKIHPPTPGKHDSSPGVMLVGEILNVLVLVLAAWIVAKVERRQLLDYNLRGHRRLFHFATGLVFGFAALSALIGAMSIGGWVHFGPLALSGGQIVTYALIWGAMFLVVGLFEEGSMRCYLLYTLTRGINFWWASGLVACMCGVLLWREKGNGAWGVYLMALIGVLPCLMLHLKKSPRAGFWNAAWFTSTLFGFVHTGNNGENWIGIFAAGAIGFVFCVSVRVTGSAWWAIGCHAAWDWAETYFYGTADSGMVAKGHLLSTTPAGSAFWSGGTDGPEGSILVLPIILLVLLAVMGLYGRKSLLHPETTPVEVAG